MLEKGCEGNTHIEKESEWILPENLRKSQELERKLVDNGTFNGSSDFGSYYAYLKGINYDFIKPHAISDDRIALEYAKNISALINKFNLKLSGNIIDIGCAIGTVTNALNILNKDGKTYGLEISEDGIKAAINNYPDCNFLCQSADNLDNFQDEYFDVIHSKEFYGFTRTGDSSYHLKYLKLFHSKLKSKGFVILQMTSGDVLGLWSTYDNITTELKNIGYESVLKIKMIPSKIQKRLGGTAYNSAVYILLSYILKTVSLFKADKKLADVYILIKK
ncbi:MAG: class I SAM-dependent methyltransferase [Nitrospirae bacterium]|nr:class I SAM-dependent methyltransferase [Nitrospirota bacterium]